MVQLAGFVYDSAGVALSTGITVNIYARNTVTPVVVSPTVNASGYWQATGVAEGRYDVEIVNGTTTRRIKYDDELQVQRVETAVLQVRNPANTFIYDVVPGAITANRTLNLPVITGTDTLAVLSLAQTFTTGVKTFNSSILAIRNPADTFSYTVVASAITAARNLTVPLITADDTLAVLGLAQTFSATQTMTSPVFLTSVTTTSTTMAVFNATATTVNAFGAATTMTIGAAASATTWTGQSITFTGANSTNNTSVIVQNTSNAAAASHAIVEAAVGGTTSTGDPQYRLTIPGGGTSWYLGADNSDSDKFTIGTGTSIGANQFVMFDPRVTVATVVAVHIGNANFPTITLASAASAIFGAFTVDTQTINYTGTTQVTSLEDWIIFAGPTLAGDTATLTVDKATTLRIVAPIEGTNVDLTVASDIRILNTSGSPTHQVGIVIESLTAGATSNLALWVQNPIQLGNATVNTTANQFHTATQGAASTTMYIGNASINVTSDARAKEDIEAWNGNGLDLIRQFTVEEFSYRDGYRPFGGVYSGKYVGLIAQQLYKVAPWTVNTQGGADCWECRTGLPCEDHLPWQARYELLSGVIIKGIQEIDQRVTALEEANMRLRRQLATAGVVPEV